MSLGDTKCTMVSLRGIFNYLNISTVDDSFGLVEIHPSETGGSTSKTKRPTAHAAGRFFVECMEKGYACDEKNKIILSLWVNLNQ